MSNYTKTTNFTAKDTLPTGNPAKIIKGSDPTFTGTVTIPTLNVSGTLTAGTITGGTY
jgi:hypothetical protein